MPEEKFPTPEINLMPSSNLADRPGGKFLQWALSWGKKIVVGTELVVLLAFFSRFWLDTTVADLAEKIDQKKAVILTAQDFETTFHSLSERVAKAQGLENAVSPLVVYDMARAKIPAGVTVNQITVDKQTVSFTGSGSEESLEELVTAFKNAPDFRNVIVEKIAKKETGLTVDFAFRANYLPSKPKNG